MNNSEIRVEKTLRKCRKTCIFRVENEVTIFDIKNDIISFEPKNACLMECLPLQ